MYTDSAYWNNKILDFEDKTHPLLINSCGTYHLFTCPEFPTYRPHGRLDWQILYVASGKAHFYFHGKEEIVTAGNMVIYRPKEEQRYYYYGVDNTEVFWVHFTGTDVKQILRSHGITDNMHLFHTANPLEYKRIFTQMIQELKLCKDDYEELLVCYFKQILIMTHRQIASAPKGKSSFLMDEMNEAISYFNKNYSKPVCIEDYANEHNMSVSWFIRNFKEYTELTPAQYILSLRISNAQTLLESTDYNVTEIASMVGYDNPLYFSRIFKKQSGLSPSDFRKQLQDAKLREQT